MCYSYRKYPDVKCEACGKIDIKLLREEKITEFYCCVCGRLWEVANEAKLIERAK